MEADLTEVVGPAGAREEGQDCLVTGRNKQRLGRRGPWGATVGV